MNVIHGKMIIYNTAFKNSNLCAPNGVRLSGYYNIDLIVDIVLFKSIKSCYLKSWFISFQKINF